MVSDTTACPRVKVKATSVCRGPDTGQKVSVRVRTPGDPTSPLTVAFMFLWTAALSVWVTRRK